MTSDDRDAAARVPAASVDTSTLSGLEVLRLALVPRAGKTFAGIGDLLEFRLIEVADGRVVFAGRPDRRHYNPIGLVHGGYAATLLDSAVGCAVHTKCPAGVGYSTLELKVNYLRPLTEKSGMVRAEGSVVHMGRRSAVAEGRLTDEAGRLCATASTTGIILRE